MEVLKVFQAVAAMVLALVATVAGAADWSDTFIGFKYGKGVRIPGNPNEIMQRTVQLQHASGYKYGHNFFNVDIIKDDNNNPAVNGGGGAVEIYAVYRHQLSLGRVTGRNFKFGPIRDLGVTAGIDLGTKNDQFAARPVRTVLGPSLDFDVPGFWNVSLLWRTERNHNGIPGAPRSEVRFDNHWGLSTSWGIPFSLGLPAVFKGYLDYVGEKGRDGFNNPTAPETLLDAALMFDVGAASGRKGTFYAGLGYVYRRNSFGVDSAFVPVGTKYSVPQIRFEAHF